MLNAKDNYERFSSAVSPLSHKSEDDSSNCAFAQLSREYLLQTLNQDYLVHARPSKEDQRRGDTFGEGDYQDLMDVSVEKWRPGCTVRLINNFLINVRHVSSGGRFKLSQRVNRNLINDQRTRSSERKHTSSGHNSRLIYFYSPTLLWLARRSLPALSSFPIDHPTRLDIFFHTETHPTHNTRARHARFHR